MSDANKLLRDTASYFDGVSDMVDGVPTEEQWAKIQSRMAKLSQDVAQLGDPVTSPAQVAPAQAIAQPQPADPPRHDPTQTVTADKWKKKVIQALEELGMDTESAQEAVRHKEFKIELNVMPGDKARKVMDGVYG